MGVPKRYFAEVSQSLQSFSQSIPPTTQVSASSIYTASNFSHNENLLILPVTGSSTLFCFSPLTGVYLVTSVGVISPSTTTGSLGLKQWSLGGTGSYVAGGLSNAPWTGTMYSGTIYTMTLAGNAREVVVFGNKTYHITSSVFTGNTVSGMTAYITYKKTS